MMCMDDLVHVLLSHPWCAVSGMALGVVVACCTAVVDSRREAKARRAYRQARRP